MQPGRRLMERRARGGRGGRGGGNGGADDNAAAAAEADAGAGADADAEAGAVADAEARGPGARTSLSEAMDAFVYECRSSEGTTFLSHHLSLEKTPAVARAGLAASIGCRSSLPSCLMFLSLGLAVLVGGRAVVREEANKGEAWLWLLAGPWLGRGRPSPGHP